MSQEIVTKPHPYIEGLLVRSDGMVYLPKSRGNNAHWTKGTKIDRGYIIRFKKKKYYIHRLVIETFKPNTEKMLYVDFNDGNRYNTNIDNLSWSNFTKNAKSQSLNPKVSILNKTLSSITNTKDDFFKLYNKAKRILHPEYKKTRDDWYNKHKDEPEYKQKQHNRHQKRKNDPEYRLKRIKNKKDWYAQHKDDPEYKRKNKERYNRRKQKARGSSSEPL